MELQVRWLPVRNARVDVELKFYPEIGKRKFFGLVIWIEESDPHRWEVRTKSQRPIDGNACNDMLGPSLRCRLDRESNTIAPYRSDELTFPKIEFVRSA